MRYGVRFFFIVAALCASALVLARVQLQRLPEAVEMVPEVFHAPRQAAAQTTAFAVRRGGLTYTITPLYAYELSGLVVSLFDTATWWNIYHKEWKDRLNIKDICVIWGDNISRRVYQRMKFSSTSFECRYETRDREAWQQFNPECLSNNHLLPADAEVERVLRAIRRGDQIFLKGYLVNYERGTEFKRGSSTTRSDTGSWSCETIYVTGAQILKPYKRFWCMADSAMSLVLSVAILGGLASWFMAPPAE